MRFFDLTQPIWQKIGKVGSIIVLSLLWILCSLPVITIGAATTALNKKVMDVLYDSDHSIIKGFFLTFREAFWKATVIWLICVIVFAVLAVDASFLTTMTGVVATMVHLLLLVAAFVFFGFFVSVFYVAGKHKGTIIQLMKETLNYSLRRIPILLAVFFGEGILCYLVYSYVLSVLPFLPGICSCLGSLVFKNLWKKEQICDEENP